MSPAGGLWGRHTGVWTDTNRPNDRLLGGATTPVMPTKAAIHDFDAASKQVMEGGPPGRRAVAGASCNRQKSRDFRYVTISRDVIS